MTFLIFVGDKDGLNFKETLNHRKYDLTLNLEAMEYAQKEIGKPDFVISDYEPISAQYAYAYDVPLFTIDQQSKFLLNDFKELNGLTPIDEKMRLNMFYPKANRIILSFFDFNKIDKDSIVLGPILRNSLIAQKTQKHTLVYLSSQDGYKQPIIDVLSVLADNDKETFFVYTKNWKYECNISIKC